MLDGQKYTFIGTMTPETKYKTQPEILSFEVFPDFVPCENTSQSQCLKIRPIKDEGVWEQRVKGEWRIISKDQIEGYQHKTDYYSMILVKRFPLQNQTQQFVDVYYATLLQGNRDFYQP